MSIFHAIAVVLIHARVKDNVFYGGRSIVYALLAATDPVRHLDMLADVL